MPGREKAYIFHVVMKDGESLILDPFRGADRLETVLSDWEIEGRFGAEPRVEMLTMFRNELYRSVDAAVRRWLSEARFIPRFLISAGAFIVSWFVVAVVLRGLLPLPLPIEEFALALGVAIAVYFAVGRKELGSESAMKKRVSLKNAIDRIKFVDSPLLKRVETALHRYESGKLDELVPEILDPTDEPLEDEERVEATEFVRMLEEQFNFRRIKKGEKVLKDYLAERGTERTSNLRRWADSQRVNFPLYAVYKRFKRTVERV